MRRERTGGRAPGNYITAARGSSPPTKPFVPRCQCHRHEHGAGRGTAGVAQQCTRTMYSFPRSCKVPSRSRQPSAAHRNRDCGLQSADGRGVSWLGTYTFAHRIRLHLKAQTPTVMRLLPATRAGRSLHRPVRKRAAAADSASAVARERDHGAAALLLSPCGGPGRHQAARHLPSTAAAPQRQPANTEHCHHHGRPPTQIAAQPRAQPTSHRCCSPVNARTFSLGGRICCSVPQIGFLVSYTLVPHTVPAGASHKRHPG